MLGRGGGEDGTCTSGKQVVDRGVNCHPARKKKVNPETVVWQKPETEYWKNFLKDHIQMHYKETNSKVAKYILDEFDREVGNFFQVCPKEMLDKLANPISAKKSIDIAS